MPHHGIGIQYFVVMALFLDTNIWSSDTTSTKGLNNQLKFYEPSSHDSKNYY
jgi:hypothetical protein